jgi:hypothetical protein
MSELNRKVHPTEKLRDSSPDSQTSTSRPFTRSLAIELENVNSDINKNKTSQEIEFTEENITYNFYNNLSTNPTLSKLSKHAKTLIIELLKEIDNNYFGRTKGIPLTFTKIQTETLNRSTNIEHTVLENNANKNEDFKIILERLNKMERNIASNDELILNLQNRPNNTNIENPNKKTFASIVSDNNNKHRIIIKPKVARETPRILTQLNTLECPKNVKIITVRTDKDKIAIRT